MNECREERTEKPEGGQSDAERIDGERAREVLPDDAPSATGAGERVDKAREIVAESSVLQPMLSQWECVGRSSCAWGPF